MLRRFWHFYSFALNHCHGQTLRCYPITLFGPVLDPNTQSQSRASRVSVTNSPPGSLLSPTSLLYPTPGNVQAPRPWLTPRPHFLPAALPSILQVIAQIILMPLHARTIITQLIARDGVLLAKTPVSNPAPESHLEGCLLGPLLIPTVFSWVFHKG